MKKSRKTAAELMAKLRSDPDFVAREQQRERQRLQDIANMRRTAAPLIAELAELGFEVSSVSELPETYASYERAIPVLVKWLPAVSDTALKETIVRALSVPFAKRATALLAQELRKAAPDQASLKWTIANALEVLADDDIFEDVAELVQEKHHGKAREMLALALGKMSNPHAVEVLIELLGDEQVAGHAVMALGRLKSRAARPAIEHFLKHPKAWIRKEAKKALASIDSSRLH
jgi:HEAT repeat protein